MFPAADVVGMEGLSAAVLSEPHNKWNDASPVSALTAVTMSSCSGLDKPVQGMLAMMQIRHAHKGQPGNVNRYVNTLYA